MFVAINVDEVECIVHTGENPDDDLDQLISEGVVETVKFDQPSGKYTRWNGMTWVDIPAAV